MSYEKKIKDLMARMVAMSPEPPPYPEEMPMARHESKREYKPWLVFAGAAVVVAALAIPVLLLTGGEPPLAADSTTTTAAEITTSVIETTTSTAPATTTTTVIEDATTTTVQTSTTVASVWQGTIFLYQEPENSFLGNPALVPLRVELADPSTQLAASDEFTTVLAALGDDLPAQMSNAIPSSVQLLDQSSADGVVIAEMNESFLDGAGGLLADTTMLNQLVYTLTQDQPTDEVLFTVHGEPVKAFGSEGLDLTEPVGRDAYIDSLGVIFLTEPISVSEQAYAVTGMANTFEGTLTVRILDGSGNLVHEDPVQASCGSGCWGEFGVELDADLIEPGESSVQVFTYSAEDGAVTDSITVPIPSGGVWRLTID